jgi:hemerythrin
VERIEFNNELKTGIAAVDEQHADLVRSIRRYVFRHTHGGERITQEMVGFIGTWITEHIMVEDMKYVDCLKGIAPKKNEASSDTEVPALS